MRWFERARQDWIAETLGIFGYIQRRHLIRKFGICIPQASADLQRFMQEHPGVMMYDKGAKRYVALVQIEDMEDL